MPYLLLGIHHILAFWDLQCVFLLQSHITEIMYWCTYILYEKQCFKFLRSYFMRKESLSLGLSSRVKVLPWYLEPIYKTFWRVRSGGSVKLDHLVREHVTIWFSNNYFSILNAVWRHFITMINNFVRKLIIVSSNNRTTGACWAIWEIKLNLLMWMTCNVAQTQQHISY